MIDTPGIRSFGLAHVTADDVLAAFDELAEAAVDCPPLCGHTAEDPECALDAWAARRARRPAASSWPASAGCSAPSARSAPATEEGPLPALGAGVRR